MSEEVFWRALLLIIGIVSMIASVQISLEMPVFSTWWTLLEIVLLFGGQFMIFLAAWLRCRIHEHIR